MRGKVLGAVCWLALCCILVAGLWPFHAPKNDVDWPSGRDGLIFGNHGTIVSSGDFENPNPPGGPCSLEIWLQPREINSWGTILAFYSPKPAEGLTLRQSWDDVVLLLKRPDARDDARTSRIYVGEVFRLDKPVLVTISSGDRGTAVYTDGALAKMSADFRLTSGDFTGRLVIGNSPVKPDSWSGELKGIAIYDRELTAAEVGQHYRDWTRTVPPDSLKTVGAAALYLFNEGGGRFCSQPSEAGTRLGCARSLFRFASTVSGSSLGRVPPWVALLGERRHQHTWFYSTRTLLPCVFFISARDEARGGDHDCTRIRS